MRDTDCKLSAQSFKALSGEILGRDVDQGPAKQRVLLCSAEPLNFRLLSYENSSPKMFDFDTMLSRCVS
jgi:hypothetical protein